MPGLWMAPWTSLVAYFCNPITQKCGREDCNPKAVPLWECRGLWSPLAREGEHMLAPGPTSLLPGVFLREMKLQAIVFILKTKRNSSVIKGAKRLWDARILRKAEWELNLHDAAVGAKAFQRRCCANRARLPAAVERHGGGLSECGWGLVSTPQHWRKNIYYMVPFL